MEENAEQGMGGMRISLSSYVILPILPGFINQEALKLCHLEFFTELSYKGMIDEISDYE